jgi:hypothetical protein
VVVMKSSIFWDITPYSPLKVNRRLGGTCRLHLQGRRINQARNKREADSKQSLRHLPTKRRFTFNGLHGVISQMIELFQLSLKFFDDGIAHCLELLFWISSIVRTY